MEIDKTGLDERLFTGFADTSKRRYIYVCNMKTNVSRWSKNAVEYFGLPGEYMVDAGPIWGEHIHPDDREMYEEDIMEVFSGRKGRHDLDYRARNKEGEYVMCTCQGVVLKGQGDEPDLFIGAIENHGIMDNIDATTNLYNIYEFWKYMEEIKQEKGRAIELLIGINNFREINDAYGYSFGDRVLREVGTRLLGLVKGKGMLFRMDGVRFACCFTHHSIEEVSEIYHEIAQVLRYEIYVDGVRVSVSISGGLVEFPEDFDTYSIQSGAGYALMQSKYEKHGELFIFDNSMQGNNRKNLELVSTLRQSILNDCDGFYLCYQPLMEAKREQLAGAEALLRWHGESFGDVPPGIFIPILENDPSFFELGNWILKRALIEAKPLLEEYPNFILNVNIAYTQISRLTFRDAVREILEETGFPAGNLCLELTERCRQLNKDYLLREISYLKSLGVKIAVDDFGTGFSSLNLLSDLPVDMLKFDRGFTKDIITNRANQSIIKAISECANDLGVHVCLEGMEDREMIDFTKRYFIYCYQGFYFSKPVPMSEFAQKYYA